MRKDIDKGNLMIKHNVQILQGGSTSVLDKYSTDEGMHTFQGRI